MLELVFLTCPELELSLRFSTPNLTLLDQASTEAIAGEGFIVTAGAIDCHVHFICPHLAYEAISSGEHSSVYKISQMM